MSHMVGQRSCTQLKGGGFDTVLPHQDYQILQTAVRSNDDDLGMRILMPLCPPQCTSYHPGLNLRFCNKMAASNHLRYS